MQTISFLKFRLQESGLGSQDFLTEKPWKLKKMLESFLHQGKKTTSVSGNLETKKRQFFCKFLYPRTRMKIFARIRIRQKKCRSETLLLNLEITRVYRMTLLGRSMNPMTSLISPAAKLVSLTEDSIR